MSTWLGSSGFAVLLATVAGTTACTLGVVERRRDGSAGPRLWPTFWFATGGLLFVMAIGRLSNVSELLTDIGREQARSRGRYELRRLLQAWVIGAVTAVWVVTIALAVSRVPERRRRYLPTAIAVFTLICFIAVRMISLHQVDAVLIDRDVLGVPVGAAIEIGLLVLVIAVSAWRYPRSSRRPLDGHGEVPPEPRPDVDAGRHVAG